jgi:hypothetical protein
MSQLRNIALTVQELEEGEFFWVLLEGSEQYASEEDVLPFVAIESSTVPYSSYTNALVAGVAAIRKIFGNGGPRG